MRSEFATAKTILFFVQLIGWLTIIGAVIGLVVGLGSRNGDAAVLSAIGSAVVGLSIILAASIATAQIATAEGVAELTRTTREGLAETVRELKAMNEAQRAAPLPASSPATGQTLPHVVQVYRGEEIERRGAGFMARGRVLPTLEEAREYIDKFKQNE